MLNRRAAAAVGAAAALSSVATAAAATATGWHVFATGSDTGDYGTYANADAGVTSPKRLAVTADAAADISWDIVCQGETKNSKAGAVVVVDVARASKCSLNASASSEAKKLHVKLLRR